MYSTEMTLDTGKLFVVDYIVKLHVKSTLLFASLSDILGVLATAHQNMELLIVFSFIKRVDSAIPAWEFKLETSDLIKCAWMKKFACSISTGCEKHGEVSCDGN